jgi:hypothetical protein
MNRGRWLLLLLLSGFVIGVGALTLWRGAPEPVVSTPLAPRAATQNDAQPGTAAALAAIALPGEAAPSVDAGVATGAATPQALVQAKPEPQLPEQGGLDFLIDTLRTGTSFRVRARAAMILARTRSPRVQEALSRALADPHPGVRAVAASGLGKQGPAARSSLEQALGRERDRKVQRAMQSALAKLDGSTAPAARPQPAASSVSSAPPPVTGLPRYYVGIGKATDPGRQLSSGSLGQVDAALRGGVARLSGVRVAPSGESPSAAKQVLGSDSRTGFYLDVSVASVTHDPGVGTRAAVNVMVGTYPGRDMRAMLKGAATLPGAPDDEESRLAAAQGALQSALRKLPGVFAQAR